MLGDKEAPKRIEEGPYTIIQGTKTMEGRGWYYDYVVISPASSIQFGSEQGNYAGGIYLSPGDVNYEEKKTGWLKQTKESDPAFYDLVIKEIERRYK